MVQLSRYKVTSDVLEKIFEVLFEVLGKHSRTQSFKAALAVVFSPPERLMAAKRVAIMYLILKKFPTSKICQILKVSRSTVSKYESLLEHDEKLRQTFSPMLRKDKLNDALDLVMDTFYGPGTYGTNWSTGWQRRKRINRKQTYGL